MMHFYFSTYQTAAAQFAAYPEHKALEYTALGLGEAGEYQGKIKKIFRDDGGILTEERRAECISELGDVLWYVSECSRALGISLEDLAKANLAKLNGRKARGTIQGSGDSR